MNGPRKLFVLMATAAAAFLLVSMPALASTDPAPPKVGKWAGRFTQKIPFADVPPIEGDVSFTVKKSGKKRIVKDFTIGTIVGTQESGSPILRGIPAMLCGDGLYVGMFFGAAAHQYTDKEVVHAGGFDYHDAGYLQGATIVDSARIKRDVLGVFSKSASTGPSPKRARGLAEVSLSEIHESGGGACQSADSRVKWKARPR